jgi:hypothetical protein
VGHHHTAVCAATGPLGRDERPDTEAEQAQFDEDETGTERGHTKVGPTARIDPSPDRAGETG